MPCLKFDLRNISCSAVVGICQALPTAKYIDYIFQIEAKNSHKNSCGVATGIWVQFSIPTYNSRLLLL